MVNAHLKIQNERELRLRVGCDDDVNLSIGGGLDYSNPIYSGTDIGDITPTEETQIFETAGMVVNNNVVVNPIPTNYGRITWNGVYITVS